MTRSAFECLAYPAHDPTLRRSLLVRILTEDAQVRLASFLRTFGNEIRESSSGLVETLDAWTKADPAYQEVEGLPIGLKSFREPPVDRVWAAAASALHLNAAGRYGTWEASFIRPISLRWGTLCTPPLRRVTVSKQGNLSKLTLFGDDGVESSVDLGTHVPVELPRNWRMLEGIDIFDQRILILDSESTAYLPLPNLSVTRSQEPTARIVATLHGAVELIREVSAEYASWVENAVWAVVPALRPGESGYSSGSMTGIHGIIYESFPVSPIVAAEGLIHEASHQYYHLGQLETLFSNGEDARLYWSPYARRDRPVDRILLAFHAFANVTLFYQGCLRADAASVTERANHEIATHTRNLRSMGAVLERSPGLTSDGRALFKVLHERLFR